MARLKDRVDRVCQGLPGAQYSDPTDGSHEAWRVGDKMFAMLGDAYTRVSVKTADIETARLIIDAGVGERAPYFHRSWVALRGDVSDDELRHRIVVSYDLIRAKLPKSLRDSFAPREGL
ncbi:MAG: MmcQ/YjbR family DNA-binding protein [Pseudomonadota bacterium]